MRALIVGLLALEAMAAATPIETLNIGGFDLNTDRWQMERASKHGAEALDDDRRRLYKSGFTATPDFIGSAAVRMLPQSW